MIIVANKGICLVCGEEIQSYHRHDFEKCSCGSSFVDGGHNYCRWGGYLVNTSVLSDAPIEVIRECDGRFGSQGRNKGKWVKFKDISNDWLDNIISYEIENRPENILLPIYIMEKQYRFENEIYIEDNE